MDNVSGCSHTSNVYQYLTLTLGKRRRREGGFCGSSIILDQLVKGVGMRRVGLTSHGPVLRQNCKITDSRGSVIGQVTSGCPSPTLNCNVAMAYVPKETDVVGNEVDVIVRNKPVKAKIIQMPFVPCTYHKK